MRLRFASLSLLVLAPPAFGGQTNWYVDQNACPGPGSGTAADPFCTIQEAILAAADGDAVLVEPGTYFENVDFLGKDLFLFATTGPGATLIDGSNSGPVMVIRSGQGPTTRVEGFTLQNGNNTGVGARGGGLRIVGSSPVIRGNVIRNCTAERGGALAIDGGAPRFEENVVQGCSATLHAAVWIGLGSTALLERNFLMSNGTQAIRCEGANAVIRLNTIYLNSGGGIETGFSSVLVEQNFITDNQGPGVYIRGDSNARILHNFIGRNTDSFAAGVYLFAAGSPIVSGNIIQDNIGGSFGGGIGLVNRSDALIEQNVISGNQSPMGAGIGWLVSFSGRGPIVRFNTLVDNDGARGSICAAGFDGDALVEANIIVALPGQVGVHCDTGLGPELPDFRFNDVHSAGGLAWGGDCPDLTGIDGNFSADPLFVDPDLRDYRLQPASPAIDAGDPGTLETGLDLDENLRALDGDLDGALAPDPGAYEFARLRLTSTGVFIPGRTVTFETTGDASLVGFLVIGTTPGTIPVNPFGTLQFGPGGTRALVGPLGALPFSYEALLPDSLPLGMQLVVQAFGATPGFASGQLSNPVERLVRGVPPLTTGRPLAPAGAGGPGTGDASAAR